MKNCSVSGEQEASSLTVPALVDTAITKLTRQNHDSVIANRPVGWATALLTPIFVFIYLWGLSIEIHVIMFCAIISIALVMWIFSLTTAFIAPLIAILLILLSGLAPAQIVLSGFSSGTFFLTFSVLGLGAVVVSTGLTYRYTLWLIRKLPANMIGWHMALFFTGVLFMPVVPSIPGRTSIIAPVLKEMTKDLGDGVRKKSFPMLYSGALDGITFLGPLFLTGAPANLFIYGLLPPQNQQAFQFMQWLLAASVTGVLLFVSYFILAWIYFREMGHIEVKKSRIDAELQRIGKMGWQEWVALLCIIILGVGVFSTSIHKIIIPLIALTVFCTLLFLGILSTEDFKEKIDWTFLFLLGSIIGIIRTMNYLNIDHMMVENLKWLATYMRCDFKIFILLLCAMIIIVRLFLPMATTNFIFASTLLPLASANAVNPWLVGFIVLVLCETSIFNYQSPHITLFRDKCGITADFRDGAVVFFRFLLLLIKLIAIFASIPYWIKIGIL